MTPPVEPMPHSTPASPGPPRNPPSQHWPVHQPASFVLSKFEGNWRMRPRQVGDLNRLGGASDLSTALTRAANQDISTNATAQPARQAQGAHRPPQAPPPQQTQTQQPQPSRPDRAQDHQQPAAATHPASPRREPPAANNAAAATDAPTANAAAADGPCPKTSTAGCHGHAPARRGRTSSRDPNAPHHTQDKAGDQSTPCTTAARCGNSPPQTHGKSPTGRQAARNSGETAQSGEQCSRDWPDTTTTDR